MNSFDSYLLRRVYDKVAKHSDRLAKADPLIDWEAFRPIIKAMYLNDTEKGGRPNDEVVMVKLLVLQQWSRAGLSLLC